jgi:hypothetical protein
LTRRPSAVDAFRAAYASHIAEWIVTEQDRFPSWVAVKSATEI